MESRHGTEVILRSSWTNIKSCCPGTSGIQDEWHHCVSSKGPTCAAQPPQPPWLPSWSPHSLHRPKLALLVLCLFSQQLVYIPGISNLLGSPWHFFFTSVSGPHALPFGDSPRHLTLTYCLDSGSFFGIWVKASMIPYLFLPSISKQNQHYMANTVSATSLTCDQRDLWGPTWLNMRKHFCR